MSTQEKTAHERGKKWCAKHSQYAHSCSDCFPVPAATDAGASALEAQNRDAAPLRGEILDPVALARATQTTVPDDWSATFDEYVCCGVMEELADGRYLVLDATPPAPPAAECASQNALRKVVTVLRQTPAMQGREFDALGVECNRALATPCQHGSEQSEIAGAIPSTFYAGIPLARRVEFMSKQWNRAVSANKELEEKYEAITVELAAQQSEIARLRAERDGAEDELTILRLDLNSRHTQLTAELAQARKATEEAQGKYADLHPSALRAELQRIHDANGALAAELRRAVGALRSAAEFLHAAQNNYTVNWAVVEQIDEAIAAYDAKHGGQS